MALAGLLSSLQLHYSITPVLQHSGIPGRARKPKRLTANQHLRSPLTSHFLLLTVTLPIHPNLCFHAIWGHMEREIERVDAFGKLECAANQRF
jgi:hypothetical protein